METKVSSRGRTMIPRYIRDALGITPHTRLEWSIKNGVIIVLPVSSDPIGEAVGIIKGRGLSTADLLEERKLNKAQDDMNPLRSSSLS